MDFHLFLCQSTHVPNVKAVTFVKLMEFGWVHEFDDLGLMGFLFELAPHGASLGNGKGLVAITHEQRAGHRPSDQKDQSEDQMFRSHFGAVLDAAMDKFSVNVCMSRQWGLIMSYRLLSCCILLPHLFLLLYHHQGLEASRRLCSTFPFIHGCFCSFIIIDRFLVHDKT